MRLYLLLCCLVWAVTACDSLLGPENDDWYITMELENAHPAVKGIAAAPNADSKRTTVSASTSEVTFLAENMWVGFSFPFPTERTTSLQFTGEYGEAGGGSAVMFSGSYAARLDVESELHEHFDFAQSLERETDEFGFMVIFSPAVISGETMVLTRARCTREGEAELTLKWADASFSSNGSPVIHQYRGEAHLKITCSRRRPAVGLTAGRFFNKKTPRFGDKVRG